MQNAGRKTITPDTVFTHGHILGVAQLGAADISVILDLADTYAQQNRAGKCQKVLDGLLLANLFLENSTRTRLSFEIAAKRLGAEVVNLTASGSSVQKGEELLDTLKTVGAMLPDIAVLRAGENGAAQRAADTLGCPVINGGDGTNEHPTQALLDALTLRRHFGRLDGLQVAICGDVRHSRVAHSNKLLLEKMGAKVVLIAPPELGVPGSLEDMAAGIADADAVMMLRIQKERMASALSFTEEQYFAAYGLTPEKLAHAKKDAVVLHPGPMNRGIEIDSAVADDPARSLIAIQVEMGVAVRMACLDLLTRGLR